MNLYTRRLNNSLAIFIAIEIATLHHIMQTRKNTFVVFVAIFPFLEIKPISKISGHLPFTLALAPSKQNH